MSVSPAAAVASRCVSTAASDLVDSSRVISWPPRARSDRRMADQARRPLPDPPPPRSCSRRRDGSNAPDRRSRKSLVVLGSERRDLRAAKVDAGHETLLIEDEGVYIVLRTGRREFPCRSLVDDHDVGPGADLPLVALAEEVECRLRHEEEGKAEGLDSCLDAAGVAE